MPLAFLFCLLVLVDLAVIVVVLCKIWESLEEIKGLMEKEE